MQELKKEYQKLLGAEVGVRYSSERFIKVGLCYPNTYYLGMSNLGIHLILDEINRRPDASCERVFLPEESWQEELERRNTSLFSFDTQRPLREFDIIAFTLTFELDYVNVLRMLKLAGIPLRSDERTESDPLIIAGGMCAATNGEPLADFVDLFIVGEGEEVLHELLDEYHDWKETKASKAELLSKTARLGGVYVPSFYDVDYGSDGTVSRIIPTNGAPATIMSRSTPDLDRYRVSSKILTENTEFNSTYLIEITRGCGRHCRFCIADYGRRYPRYRSVESVEELGREALKYTDRIGLIGASISDHPQINEISTRLVKMGARISAASLRSDSITGPLLDALATSGHNTITIAPEVASERLQRIINKAIPREQVYATVEEAVRRGITGLKLYFMVGIPTETEEDVHAIVDFASQVKSILGSGKLRVTVSPLVPKPQTPFQWTGIENYKSIDAKLNYLKKHLNRIRGVRMSSASAREAEMENMMSRGDRRMGAVLYDMVEMKLSLKEAMRLNNLDSEFYTRRQREIAEVLPWSHINLSVDSHFLAREYARAEHGAITSDCILGVCKKCGSCDDELETAPLIRVGALKTNPKLKLKVKVKAHSE